MASPLTTANRIDLLNTCLGDIIQSVVLDPVKLTLIFNELSYDYPDDDDESGWLKSLQWDTVVLPKTKLRMTSKQTGNTDNRGGGCGCMRFPQSMFVWDIENKDGITLKNLAEAIYRMKGSKYDWWYELFSGVMLLQETDDRYEMMVSFDYGS